MNCLKYASYLLLLHLLLSGPLYAQINSWVDENGIRRYSNSPPEKPEGSYEVIEEVENEETPKKTNYQRDNWKERLEQKLAEEKADKEEQLLKKQKTDKKEKINNAYEALNKLKTLVAGDIDWDEYKKLLVEAKARLDLLTDIPDAKDERKLLTEAYESFALVTELKRWAMGDQEERLIKRIKKMNDDWGTNAPNSYFKAREICWQRAAAKLKEFGSTP